MKYVSTRGHAASQSFTDILLEGLAPDGGLMVPESWPRIMPVKLQAMRDLPYPRLAFEILRFFADDFPGAQLKAIVEKTYTAEAFGTPEITPLATLEPNLHLLALSNGPTLAFKDIAMQLLGNLFEHVLEGRDRRLNVLGATSGDTGSAAEHALKGKVGDPLGMSAVEAAEGILRIAATAMSYAVRGVTTERGLDAGDFVLFAYGGAGPLHAVEVAREIGMTKVIVPFAPGVFSAFGMLFADLRYDFVRTWYTLLDEVSFGEMERVYRALEKQGRDAIAGTSIKPQQIAVKRSADMRYVGQEHAVTVDLPMAVFASKDRDAIKRHFDSTHAQRYGTSAPAERAEIVSLRSTVTGLMRKPPQTKISRGSAAPAKTAPTGKRKVFYGGRFHQTPTYRRDALAAGNRIKGPALIEEYASTTVLMPGDVMTVDALGNLVIAVGGR